jgi:hypothetical protein
MKTNIGQKKIFGIIPIFESERTERFAKHVLVTFKH